MIRWFSNAIINHIKQLITDMILNDKQILALAKKGMITPFQEELIREVDVHGHPDMPVSKLKVISYGLSGFGYDLRLSPKEFKIFRRIPGEIVNPKRFNSDNLIDMPLQQDVDGWFFIVPSNSYGLGLAVEKLDMPDNVIAICLGKSTYARAGVIVNVTPAEPSWRGWLTLEFSNSSSADVRIYANEGACQLLFLQGESCQTSYSDRSGKYQNQPEQIVFSKV